jgi:DNA-directed RNA polymerase subunit alpha
MRKFEKPKFKITDVDETSSKATFVVEPLERGYGTTLGNALRRVLLSSLPGASMYSIEVEGARHEFSALPGVQEDLTTIILNLKDLVLDIDDGDNISKKCTIEVEGPAVVTGDDIVCPIDVEVIRKDFYI